MIGRCRCGRDEVAGRAGVAPRPLPARGGASARVVAALLALLVAGAGVHLAVGAVTADRVLIEKRAHRLTLLRAGSVLRTYRVALGSGGLERKLRQGDARVPEGIYRVDSRNANSGYHRALHISYPSAADVARARAAGYQPGGDVMIHGIKNGFGWLGSLHAEHDWTLGCIAVTDPEIEEIWRLVPNGCLVEIRP